jgi:Ser/Thr protein kinase RdoA (MazF antagonist)
MTGNLRKRGETLDNLIPVAERFKPSGKIEEVREFGSGLVNVTFLVTLDSGDDSRFILQRINTDVFSRPKRLMRNLRTISDHVRDRLKAAPPGAGRRWEVPRPLLTEDGGDHWIDAGGSFWRAIGFIDDARTFDTIQDAAHAAEVGHALGTFQNLLSGLPAEKLAVTLEGFHVTPRYLAHFDEVVGKNPPRKSAEVDHALKFVSARREWAGVLEEAREAGKLGLRPIHGDPKVNNVMMDARTGRAVAMIDLDTAGPGLIHYDIGDCLRSCCNPLGEETGAWEEVRFDPDLCRAVLSGYLPAAGAFLTDADYEYLYGAVRLIAFELGLRFLTDYLEGNVYFRTRDKEHNLRRALVQFKLAESIESQEKAIRAIVRDLK